MTFFGLVTMWLAGKLIDAFLSDAAGSPASTPASPPGPPRRGPAPARRRPQTAPSAPKAPASTSSTPSAPPWPQVVPAGLPPFPGAGWQPDQPPPPAVVARAQALLPLLWQGGAGTFKVEQTAARWIAYQATPMGEKRGVVAWRQRAPVAVPSAAQAATSSPMGLPTLRRGSFGPEVKIVQRKLRLTDDGAFGPATEAAVKEFQRSAGLTPDGVVGPATWSVLVGQVAA